MAKKFYLAALFLILISLSHTSLGQILKSGKVVIDEKNLPYHLKIGEKRPKVHPLDVQKYVDLNGDGVDELVCVQHERGPRLHRVNSLVIKSLDGRYVYGQFNTPGLLMEHFYFYDLDNNRQKEVFFVEKTEDEIYLHIFYNLDGSYTFSFQAISRQQYGSDVKAPAWDASIVPKWVMDFNNDGRLDVLVVVRTGYARYPRGIMVFDCLTGELIWQYLMGTAPQDVWVVDLNSDGKQEVIVSTDAPSNGAVANGTDDNHSYLMVLSQDGHLLWSKQLGGTFSGIITDIIDVEKDGQWEIVGVKHWHYAETRERGFLTLWNGITGEQLKSVPFEESFTWIKSMDVNQDGNKEIVIVSAAGNIKIFNSRLQLLKEMQIDFLLKGVDWLGDIDLDGCPDFALRTSQGKTLLLNTDFKVLTIFNEFGRIQKINPGFGKKKRLLLTAADYFYVFSLKKNVRYTVSKWKHPVLGLVIFLFLFGVGAIVWKTSQRSRESLLLARKILEATPHGILFLDKRGRVKLANRNFERILALRSPVLVNKSYKEIFVDRPIVKDMIANSYSTPPKKVEKEIKSDDSGEDKELRIQVLPLFERGAREAGRLVIVEDQTEQKQLKKSLAWTAMAQRLTHEIKNPLTTILLGLQRLQMEYRQKDKKRASDYDKFTEAIIERINYLTKVTRGFMKFADIERLNLQPHDVNALLDRVLNEYSTGFPEDITLKREFASNLPKVNLDEEQFRTMIENLIDNAINAMDKGGTLTITTSLARKLQPLEDEARWSELVQIDIMDTGKGISPQNIEKLFHPYFSLEKKGTGLGLTIVKKIVEDHGGTIEVHSEEGMWTVFTIYLPV